MILVFGATGRTGKAVVKALLEKQATVKVMVRQADKARDLFGEQVEIVEGEIVDQAALAKAFKGVSKVYLLLGNSETQLSLEKRITDMAVECGVKLLVKQSSMESLEASDKPIPALHVESEKYIKSSGLNWVMIRPTFFAQMLLTCARGVTTADTLSFPLRNGVVAVTDARDVAEVAAKVLTESGHENKSYDLTGPELLSFNTIAALLSRTTERQITYKDMPLETYRAILSNVIDDEWRVNAVCEELDALAHNCVTHITGTIEQLLGRPPRSAADFLTDYKAAFMPQ